MSINILVTFLPHGLNYKMEVQMESNWVHKVISNFLVILKLANVEISEASENRRMFIYASDSCLRNGNHIKIDICWFNQIFKIFKKFRKDQVLQWKRDTNFCQNFEVVNLIYAMILWVNFNIKTVLTRREKHHSWLMEDCLIWIEQYHR